MSKIPLKSAFSTECIDEQNILLSQYFHYLFMYHDCRMTRVKVLTIFGQKPVTFPIKYHMG